MEAVAVTQCAESQHQCFLRDQCNSKCTYLCMQVTLNTLWAFTDANFTSADVIITSTFPTQCWEICYCATFNHPHEESFFVCILVWKYMNTVWNNTFTTWSIFAVRHTTVNYGIAKALLGLDGHLTSFSNQDVTTSGLVNFGLCRQSELSGQGQFSYSSL